MDDNATHAELPPRAVAWLLVALAGVALGLLRTTVAVMRHDDGTAEAALSSFVIVGPTAVLLYFFLMLIKRPVRLGFFLAIPARAAAATLNRPRFGAASFRVERMASCRRRLTPLCVSGP